MPEEPFGKVLKVDLAKEETDVLDYSDDAKRFLGGSGLACKILHDMISDPGTLDPLSPENLIAFMTGPLTGTSAPAFSRYAVCSKSPMTNGWGEATSGGFFPAELRKTGYDGLLFIGKSEKPVHFILRNEKALFEDASDLWELNTYETSEKILEKYPNSMQTACIGPAGENLVRYACIINDITSKGREGVAGRTGMGAVMGSKNLKAVSVSGDKKIRTLAEDYDDLAKEVFKKVSLSFRSKFFSQGGTAGYVDMGVGMGDLPTKYWTTGVFEDASNLGGGTIRDEILKDTKACYMCPVGCGRWVQVKGEDYQFEGKGPEYESVAALGSLCGISDLEAVSYAHHRCDELGMDVISTGACIAFCIFLFKEGILDEGDIGMELDWNKPSALIELLEMIAKREGIGDDLAEGMVRFAEKYGATEFETTVKSLEVPMHDPRAFHSMAVTYATSPRGACHQRGDTYQVHLGDVQEELGIEMIDRFAKEGAGELAAKRQNFRTIYNSLVACEFGDHEVEDLISLIEKSIGLELDEGEFMKTGERIINLKRIFNLECGFGAEDDKLPEFLLKSVEGGSEGKVPDLDEMLEEYYEFRDWDKKSGEPEKRKLKELGLEDIGEDL